MSTTALPRSFPSCILYVVLCLPFAACALFDNTRLDQQRAEIERLRQEADKLKQEANAIKQQGQQEAQEREACNKAFHSFDAARKATDDREIVTHYREGLRLCPSDDVAHNELGELYLRMGRRSEAASEFQEALRLNPNFSRAQKNLDATR